MNCEDIKLMISEYIDNELPKGRDVILFTHISGCPECREEFRHQNLIQHTVMLNRREVTGRLEQRIFNSIQDEKKVSIKWIAKPVPAYVNYILGLIIVVITLFSFLQVSSLRYDLNDIRARYDTAIDRIQYQSRQMDLMMNNVPAVRITGQPVKIIN